jgi:hypothetical protein
MKRKLVLVDKLFITGIDFFSSFLKEVEKLEKKFLFQLCTNIPVKCFYSSQFAVRPRIKRRSSEINLLT